MPKRSFALERGGPKRLEIEWSGIWKNIRIALDGQPVGTIPDSKALKAGQSFALKDGTTLSVQLVQTFGSAELRILRNGEPLPGSGSDPVERLKLAYGMIWFIAGLNAVFGVIAMAFKTAFFERLGLGLATVIEGAVFFFLGWLVKTYRSSIALGIAVALFAIDGILTIGASAGSGTMPVGPIVMRVLLILPMIRGFGAIRELKTAPSDPMDSPAPAGAKTAKGASGPGNDPWQGPGGPSR